MAKKDCSDCGERAKELYLDPRFPPLEETACLCLDCYDAALTQELEETRARVVDLKATLKALKKRRKK